MSAARPQPNDWIALVGTRTEGRADLAFSVAKQLREDGYRVGGALEVSVEVDGECIGYDLQRLDRDERIALARLGPDLGDKCGLRFDREALDIAHRWATMDAMDVVFLDAGALEASKRGLWPAIEGVLEHDEARVLVLCVRPRYLAGLALELDDPVDGIELATGPADPRRFARVVADALSAARRGSPAETSPDR